MAGAGAFGLGVKLERAARGRTAPSAWKPITTVTVLVALVVAAVAAVLLRGLDPDEAPGQALSAPTQEGPAPPVVHSPPTNGAEVGGTPTDVSLPAGPSAAAAARADLGAFLASLCATDTAGLLQAVVEVWVDHHHATPDPGVRAVFQTRYAEIYRDGGAATGLPATFDQAIDYFAN